MNSNSPEFPFPNVRADFVYVTPDMARRLLDSSPGNRPIKALLVERIARDMADGKFMFNGESISTDEHGRLMEGHHRCHASIKSGMGFWTVLVSAVPRAAMATINTGSSRSGGDLLTLLGLGGKNHSGVIMAIIRGEQNGIERAFVNGGKASIVTNAQIEERVIASPGLIEVCDRAKAESRHCGLPPRVYGALYYFFSQIDADDAEEFFSKLATGAGLEDGDPILTVRNGLLTIRARGSRSGSVPHPILAAHVIKAWNKFRSGDRLRIFRYSEHEQYPLPI